MWSLRVDGDAVGDPRIHMFGKAGPEPVHLTSYLSLERAWALPVSWASVQSEKAYGGQDVAPRRRFLLDLII